MGFIWFWIVAVMIVAYVVLDGFDLGVGILHSIPRAHRRRAPALYCAPSARSGTATKSGFSPPAARSISPSPCSTLRLSAASICL